MSNYTIQLLTNFIINQNLIQDNKIKETINPNSKDIKFLEKKRNSDSSLNQLYSLDYESRLERKNLYESYKKEDKGFPQPFLKEIEIKEEEKIENKDRLKIKENNLLINPLNDSKNINNLVFSLNESIKDNENNLSDISNCKENENNSVNKKASNNDNSINFKNVQKISTTTSKIKNIFIVNKMDGNYVNHINNNNNEVKVFKNKKVVYVNSILLDSYYSSKNLKKVKKIAFIGRTKRSSRFRGVSKNGNQWQVLIMYHKNKSYAGCYSSEEIAARIYDILAIKKRGIKARTNFVYNIIQMKKISEMDIDIKSKNINEIIENLFS